MENILNKILCDKYNKYFNIINLHFNDLCTSRILEFCFYSKKIKLNILNNRTFLEELNITEKEDEDYNYCYLLKYKNLIDNFNNSRYSLRNRLDVGYNHIIKIYILDMKFYIISDLINNNRHLMWRITKNFDLVSSNRKTIFDKIFLNLLNKCNKLLLIDKNKNENDNIINILKNNDKKNNNYFTAINNYSNIKYIYYFNIYYMKRVYNLFEETFKKIKINNKYNHTYIRKYYNNFTNIEEDLNEYSLVYQKDNIYIYRKYSINKSIYLYITV